MYIDKIDELIDKILDNFYFVTTNSFTAPKQTLEIEFYRYSKSSFRWNYICIVEWI